MRPYPSSIDVRRTIARLAARDGTALAFLSRAMGHGDRFLSRHVRDGRPEWLGASERSYLACFFNVDTFELGDREKVRPG